MPLDALPYSDLMEKFGFVPADHTAPKFFPVETQKLYDQNGHALEGWQRIARSDTGDTLHIATDSYRIVPNEEAFGSFEEALRESVLDLTDMQIGTDYSGNGARCFRQYLLPAHQVEVRPGVSVALRLLMMNSYDGTLRFRGQCGAYNFVCANTSILGVDYAQFAMRHTGGVDVRKAVSGLARAAEDHLEITRRWKAWPDIPCTDAQALDICAAMPLGTDSLTDHLVHSWLKARDDDSPNSGANAWCLFNVLTAWSTHSGSQVAGGRGQARFDREKRVAKLMEGKEWRALVGE